MQDNRVGLVSLSPPRSPWGPPEHIDDKETNNFPVWQYSPNQKGVSGWTGERCLLHSPLPHWADGQCPKRSNPLSGPLDTKHMV